MLAGREGWRRGGARQIELPFRHHQREVEQVEIVDPRVGLAGPVLPTAVACDAQFHRLLQAEHPARQPAAGREHSGIEIETRSEQRRVGKEWVSTCRSRVWTYN